MPDPMLNEDIRKQVRELFAELDRPVAVFFFGSEDQERCDTCAETRQLLSEVIGLSNKLALSSYDIDGDAEIAEKYKIDAVPSFVMLGNDDGVLTDFGVRFKGIPAGHEFSSLVNDLVLVSKRDSGLSADTRNFLSSLEKPVHLQVFVTPT